MPAGRPSDYSVEIGDRICERMHHGETLRAICRDDGFPDRHTVLRWCNKFPEFYTQYAQAREALQDYWADEIVEIADDASNDFMTIKRGDLDVEVENKEVVNRSRLRIDSRKWLMSKLAPKKFGDKLEVVGKDDTPLIPVINLVTKPKD